MADLRLRTGPTTNCVRETSCAFGPEELVVISAVYGAILTDLGLSDQEDAVTLLVARRLIELASEELDPDRLRSAALASIRR
jgi:hypothetical protein